MRRVLLRTLMFSVLVIIAGIFQLALAQDDAPPVERLVPRILATYPHDTMAFTEGLLLVDGLLYESTGHESGNRSSLTSVREVQPETGEILKLTELNEDYFGEGLALIGDQFVQLTWKDGIRVLYDPQTLDIVGKQPYADEGWGMCYDGEHVYTSNGSTEITERDAGTFAVVAKIEVTLQGQPINQINELECVGDAIYANVWYTENILRIDKATGIVNGLIDASGMLTPEQRAQLTYSGATMNGIAYDEASGTFLLTGKLWPWTFRVEFVPDDAAAADATEEASG